LLMALTPSAGETKGIHQSPRTPLICSSAVNLQCTTSTCCTSTPSCICQCISFG
jgi:hypothetical protein